MSILNVLPSTKGQVEDFTNKLKWSIMEGEVDPIQAAIQIATLEKISKILRSDGDIKNLIVDELMKYEKGKTTHQGNEIALAEAGVKYDFQNDEKLDKLLDKKKALDLKIKARQEELKAVFYLSIIQDFHICCL